MFNISRSPMDRSLKCWSTFLDRWILACGSSNSASAFRTRWEKILDAFAVPKSHRPTPAGVRGGGAILAYKRGEPIQDIMWRMRLVSQNTLEHYLRELAAESLLAKLPEHSRAKVRCAASFCQSCLQSPGKANHVPHVP